MKFSPERFVQNIVPDLKDNLESGKPPIEVVEKLDTPADAAPLAERFLPSEMRRQLESETADLELGEYRARVAVGSAEDGTRHPHDYIIEKEASSLTLYFVDPEHQMGKSKNKSPVHFPRKGDFRPKTSTLIGIKMTDGDEIPVISIIRYRAAAITDSHLLKMEPQLEMVKSLLETGEIPEVLAGKENEITFRLNMRKDGLLVQSRYASPEELELFLQGKPSAAVLEGKVHSSNVIMRHFLNHLESKRFQKSTNLE